MSDHYELTRSDYLEIARRRWLFLVCPFLLVSLASVAIALWIPPVYKSTGTILIESQQVPDALIRSTVTSYADERIQVIEQLVMTRQNLLRIIEKFDLFAGVRDKLTVSEQVDLMHEGIEIARLAGDTLNSSSRTAIAFTVSFQDSSSKRAQEVANELVTLFLEKNVKARTDRASETTEFLTQEATKLKHDLEKIEEQMASYKQENSEALPEHLDLHMKMLERTEMAIKDTERNIKAAEEEIRFLEIELTAINVGVTSNGGQSNIAKPVQTLAAAEAELALLQSRYSDRHPDIRRLKNQIAKQEAEASGAGPTDPATARVREKMVSVRDSIKSLKAQSIQLELRRNELEGIIVQTPQVQRALVSLNRDYENTLSKYTEIQAKEMEAKLAESLEEGKKAERFSLLEPPQQPEKPIKPNRGKIILMGVFLAIAASLGFVALLEGGDKRLRGADALTALLKERPLVAIPYITTDDELQKRRRTRKWLIAVAFLAVLVLLAGIHVFYMSLDLLIIKAMVRLG